MAGSADLLFLLFIVMAPPIWRPQKLQEFLGMSVERPKAKIASIQCLRGIAALMIVIYHLQNQLGHLGIRNFVAPALPSGVDIFLVISGFIMWVTTAMEPNRSAISFYRDRVTRIIPLYWFATTFMVGVLLIDPSLTHSAVLNWPHIVKSYAFIPSIHPKTGEFQPILIPGWTLNLEMFFYVIFGAAIAACGRNLKARACTAISTLTLFAICGDLHLTSGVFSFYSQEILMEFVFGILIAALFLTKDIKESRWYYLPLLIGVIMLIVSNFFPYEPSRLLRWGVPSALIVFGAVFCPQPRLAMLEHLGDWSYALYLSHPITLAASERLWELAASGIPLIFFPIFAVFIAITASWVLYHAAERPMTRFLRAWLSPNMLGSLRDRAGKRRRHDAS